MLEVPYIMVGDNMIEDLSKDYDDEAEPGVLRYPNPVAVSAA